MSSNQQGRQAHPRQKAYEIADRLQRSTSLEAAEIKQMIGFYVEDAKTRLVEADETNIMRLQGEAQAFTRLYRRLTEKTQISQE